MTKTMDRVVAIGAAKHTFLTEDFLLYSEQAKVLYHEYAASMPIIDYHNHLPPNEMAENKRFANLTEIWLKGDHYKWRAMRSLGIDEHLITGEASDKEKFLAWAKAVPKTVRNPLFHWTQMELKKPFGICEYLNEHSAKKIYEQCNALLQTPEFSTRSILKSFNVKMVGTTDDPCDNLAHHQLLAKADFGVKVLPSFRPDKIFNIADSNGFFTYIERLENCSGIKITDISSLLSALQTRIDFFHDQGCRISDHGIAQLPNRFSFSAALEMEFKNFLAEKSNSKPFSDADGFMGYVLVELSKMYHAKGWVQQFHLGALRNNNSRLLSKIGADAGVDSIGDFLQAKQLSHFLDTLEATNQLAKTILYNLNPADNEVFASMVGNFNDGKISGKIQYGAAWWFLDQKDGMEKQINTLSNMGLISNFIGMLTDSRSFLSYSRHEYFRRILCNMLGEEMKKGELPNDASWIGEIVKDICYNNAKQYFNF